MGRQIGFYMTRADEQSFSEALQADADVVVVPNQFSANEPPVLEALPPTGSAVGNDTNLSIYNRGIEPKLFVYEIAAIGKFALDLPRSEVIQFNRSFFVMMAYWNRDGSGTTKQRCGVSPKASRS